MSKNNLKIVYGCGGIYFLALQVFHPTVSFCAWNWVLQTFIVTVSTNYMYYFPKFEPPITQYFRLHLSKVGLIVQPGHFIVQPCLCIKV